MNLDASALPLLHVVVSEHILSICFKYPAVGCTHLDLYRVSSVLSVIFKGEICISCHVMDTIVSDVRLEGIGRGAKQEDEAVIKQGQYINT